MPSELITMPADVARRRADLESKLKELTGFSPQRQELYIDYAADPLDQVRLSTDREMAVQQLDQRTRLLHDIQSALEKLDDGTYGRCERCDEMIPRRRLDAVPWARLCVPCQSASEAASQEGSASFEEAA